MAKGQLTVIKAEMAEAVQESHFPVSRNLWRQILRRIEECSESLLGVEAFAWVCIGIAGDAFVGLITFPFSAQFSREASPGVQQVNWLAIATCVILLTHAGRSGDWLCLITPCS